MEFSYGEEYMRRQIKRKVEKMEKLGKPSPNKKTMIFFQFINPKFTKNTFNY